jgi:hypothetical protein
LLRSKKCFAGFPALLIVITPLVYRRGFFVGGAGKGLLL